MRRSSSARGSLPSWAWFRDTPLRGRGGARRGTQVEGADPGNVSLGTTFPRHRFCVPGSRSAPIKCSWKRVFPLEDCSRLAARGHRSPTHTLLELPVFLLLQLGTLLVRSCTAQQPGRKWNPTVPAEGRRQARTASGLTAVGLEGRSLSPSERGKGSAPWEKLQSTHCKALCPELLKNPLPSPSLCLIWELL